VRALVLAAGMGTRIRALAGPLPKVMVPVAGVPVVDRVLAWLARSGVHEVAVNLHHEAERLAAHLATAAPAGVRVRLSHEEKLLGTAGALRPLTDFLTSPFVVVYGDVVTDLDLGNLLARHRALGAALTMSLYDVPNPTECGIVGLDERGRVTRFVEKPARGEVFSTLANSGVLVIEPSVLDHVPPARGVDFGHDVIPALLAEGAVVAGLPLAAGETVIDIGTPEGYERAERWCAERDRDRAAARSALAAGG
jgi:NDP-sugar pyrophosphorylase family protein